MAQSHNGASKAAPPLFSASTRAKLLAQRLNAPTDVTIEVGGVTLALRPLSSHQAFQIFDLIDEIAKLSGGLKNIEAVDGSELAAFLAVRGKEVVDLVKSVLHRAAAHTIDGEAGEAVFEEWFATLDLLPTVRALFPKIIEANGLSAMLARPPKAAPAEAPGESLGTPSTPQATS